jgi:Family of unknown function (DUF6506)
MSLARFGFIVKGPGYVLGQHFAKLESDTFHTSVIGVSDMDGAFDAAKIMLKDGIQLIELCGGFSEEEAAQVRLSIGEKVPVGVVVYDAKSSAEIQKLFG